MQRKLSFLIFLLLFAFTTSARAVESKSINGIPVSSVKTRAGLWDINKIKAHNGFAIASAAPELTCTVLSSNTTTNADLSLHRYNTLQYGGLIWDDGASGSICKYQLRVTVVAGDVSTKDYYAEVWLLGASFELSSLIGRSDKVDGSTSWNYVNVDFVFSTPAAYDCTGANQYGIITKAIDNEASADTAGSYSGTIYINTRFNNGTNTMTGCVGTAQWNSATKALSQSDATDMPYVAVWTMQ